MLKLALSEKVTDDLMLVVNSPFHRNQVIWQNLLPSLSSSFSLLPLMKFFFPDILCLTSSLGAAAFKNVLKFGVYKKYIILIKVINI